MENEKNAVSSLCPDVLVSIFQFLSTESKGKAAQVCTSWKKAADYKAIWKSTTVRLSGKTNALSENNIIKRGIKWFDLLVYEPITIELLRKIPDVEHLRFLGCCIKRNMGNFFQTIPNHDIALLLGVNDNYYREEPTDYALENRIGRAFFYYHKLHNFSCRLDNALILKTLSSGIRKLKVLHLEGCLLFGDESNFSAGERTENKDQLPSLEKLCLKNLQRVNEGTIDYISQRFLNLVSLSIEAITMNSQQGFVNLPKLEKLEYLSFFFHERIGEAPLNSISKLSKLKFLDLGFGREIAGSGLEFISRLKNLVSFKACELVVADADFRHLNHMPLLRELEIPYSEISDTGLLYLAAGNLNLTKLDISGSENVTDQGLLNICQSTFDLHYFGVSECKVTDYGIRSIMEKFSHLQVLHVDSCDYITDTTRQLISENLHGNESLNAESLRQDRNRIVPNIDPLDSRLGSFLDHMLKIVPSPYA